MGNFCARGREIESSHTNHIFTEEELRVLEKEESQDYLPANSTTYRKWLKKYKTKNVDNGLDKWFLMGAVGVSVGFVGFLAKSCMSFIVTHKFSFIEPFVEEGDLAVIWVWLAGISLLLVLFSSLSVILVSPEAAGSGIPEVIGYLNGVQLRRIWRFRIFVVKFFSVICAVASGLPCGPEGPMIHMGALIGKGLSQGTYTNKNGRTFTANCFHRFRTMKHMRDFISAGSAAGIASAFGAPVGGLLFSMEEVSSFWNQTLSWQIFFCSMCATFTTDLFVSAFGGFTWKGTFGAFNEEDGIIFAVDKALSINIFIFIPAVILGLAGGVLGALFTFLNLKITRCRRIHINPHPALRVLEPMLIALIAISLAVFLPLGFNCVPGECPGLDSMNATEALEAEKENLCAFNPRWPLYAPDEREAYFCTSEQFMELHLGIAPETTELPEGSEFEDVVVEAATESEEEGEEEEEGNSTSGYNPMASLLFVEGEETIAHLLSRNTFHAYDYPELITLFLCYFPLAAWCAGTAISSGIVVPMLLLGGCMGRILGLGMVDMFGVHPEGYWSWIDEGAIALIGASAFFAGVSRLTMSLTVIMVEITNDIRFLLPIMTAVIVAKMVADGITHSLYHALLEVKCIPFLPDVPRYSESLELHQVSKIMSRDVKKLPLRTTAGEIAQVLDSCDHNAFPVVDHAEPGPSSGDKEEAEEEGGEKVPDSFVGMIRRAHLERILAAVLAHQAKKAAREGVELDAVHLKSVTVFHDEDERQYGQKHKAAVTVEMTSLVSSGDNETHVGDFDDVESTGIEPEGKEEAHSQEGDVRISTSNRNDSGSNNANDNNDDNDNTSKYRHNLEESATARLVWSDLEEFGTSSWVKLGQQTAEDFINAVLKTPRDRAVPVDLSDFVSTSSFTVTADFSVERAFLLFRTMGLRHLAVLGSRHDVVGMLTRKEMMGYHIENSLHGHDDHHSANSNNVHHGDPGSTASTSSHQNHTGEHKDEPGADLEVEAPRRRKVNLSASSHTCRPNLPPSDLSLHHATNHRTTAELTMRGCFF